jgi:fermentation-respiration switch protein FrsA (DUF1100 family)
MANADMRPGNLARRFIPRLIWILIVGVILVYSGMGMWFVINEQRLVLHPSRTVEPPENTPDFAYTRVDLRTKDDVRLTAWEMRCPRGDSTGIWVLYLHGNSGNISDCVDRYRQIERLGVNVFAGDYRGFGESQGHPDEEGFYTDAATMADYLTDAHRVPPHHIILYGHSLGAAVAIELAGHIDAACLIVEGGFTSMVDRAQSAYPLLPVRWMAHFRFDSRTRIREISMPKLFVHASDDATIPIAEGRELFADAAPPKSFLSLHGGHTDCILVDDEKFLNGMRAFLVGNGVLPVHQKPISELSP